ncbi:hypothetical protein [Haloarcula montana]|uniref:hypothetical protein n=1 Tax=Haloarcula montana TaxID=3111776 RepID=UPI002D790084|nr:hypothetical protein [Haloarcula sp. GH36]
MPGDIDNTADALSRVRTNGNLDTVEITDVTEEGHEVCLHMELPGGASLEQCFKRPPVWGANCDLKRFLDAYGLAPDEVDELTGKRVPVDREVVDGTLQFEIDIGALPLE